MLTLRYNNATTIPVEAEVIAPEHFAGKSAREIAALPVQHGNAQAPLGEFFAVDGNADDGRVVVEGDCCRVKLIGSGMQSGTITVRGNAGMHLGAEMRGGAIHVLGNVGDWVGAELRGGVIHVHGDAGHHAGAGYRGSRLGMRGGRLLIDGNAGNEIGSGMRRGLIAIGGDAGDFTGVGLIAGSILVFGKTGIRVGANMRRGTIALFGPPTPLLPTFHFDCVYQPVFMRLYLRLLERHGFTHEARHRTGSYRRFSGDLVASGKGEVLWWQAHYPLAG
jgi:formylmethanofuran dehydrogenase subunit C